MVSALLVLVLFLCSPLTAHAKDVPQQRNDCSIELIVRADPSAGGDGSCYVYCGLDALLQKQKRPAGAITQYRSQNSDSA